MPWSSTTPMDEKTKFIADHLRGTFSISELCTSYGISRKTADKWIDRYLHDGPAGLEDRSRKPYTAPNSTPQHVVEALLAVRGHHPSWGARKLLAFVERRVEEAKPVFTRIFKEYGLPSRIRTDNGVPFATNSLARLSQLSAWWVRLGVLPELIEPGKPQQNGRHERMHRTLKAETSRPPSNSRLAQQRRFDRFREEFNNERPHEALEMKTPASVYTASSREMPDRLPRLEYPAISEVRYVSANGGIRWNCRWVNLSTTCIGEHVGLEEVDDGIWNVYFGPLRLGRLLERHMRIEDAYGRLERQHRL